MKTLEELTEYIQNEISYDGQIQNEYTCKKCKYHHEEISYWIDNKSALAYNITSFLGFKNKLANHVIKTISEVLDCAYVVRDETDAPRLAKEIFDGLGIKPGAAGNNGEG